MNVPRPTQLKLTSPQALRIVWSDGQVRDYTVKALRDACPCATCREQRMQSAGPPPLLPILSAAEAKPLTLLGMDPVGGYAYSLHFSDGHDTGIFTLEHLRELGREVAPA